MIWKYFCTLPQRDGKENFQVSQLKRVKDCAFQSVGKQLVMLMELFEERLKFTTRHRKFHGNVEILLPFTTNLLNIREIPLLVIADFLGSLKYLHIFHTFCCTKLQNLRTPVGGERFHYSTAA